MDTSGPQVSNIDLSSRIIDTRNDSRLITAIIHVTDESGVDITKTPDPYWFNIRDISGTRINSKWTLVSGTATDGVYASSIELPLFPKSGEWLVGCTAFRDLSGYSSTNGGYSSAFYVLEGDAVRTLQGMEQNDFFFSASGIESIDGEQGLDTVRYSGTYNQYQINKNLGVVLDKEPGRDGLDTLVHVERLKFSDVNLALDIDGNAGAAYRLYKAAFDRTPDLGGLGYWIAQLDKGGKLIDAATYFTISPEFQSLYGSQTSDSQFVNLLYQHVLHRAAEGEGYNFWVNALSPSGGWSRGGVLEFFSQSPENQGQTAELVANGIQYQEWLG